MNRKVAILNDSAASFSGNVRKTVDLLMETGFADEITVFAKKYDDVYAFERNGVKCSCVEIPPEADTEPKARNWINSGYRRSGFGGMLYVVKDSTEITGDMAVFSSDLEKMMRAFGYYVWFSTVTDPCNYVYSKYNPRISINMDRPDAVEKTGLACDVNFTSHSNTQMVVYDFSAVPDDMLRFDERFTVPMFWIIEFLARRRNTASADSLFFMNQYMTVDTERGAFRIAKQEGGRAEGIGQDRMGEENSMFKSMSVDYSPDNSIDAVLERFWTRIKSI